MGPLSRSDGLFAGLLSQYLMLGVELSELIHLPPPAPEPLAEVLRFLRDHAPALLDYARFLAEESPPGRHAVLELAVDAPARRLLATRLCQAGFIRRRSSARVFIPGRGYDTDLRPEKPMKTPAPTILRLLDESLLLRRLDRIPFQWTLAIGAAIGLTLSAGIFLRPSATAFAAVTVVIALAGALAWSAQPVGVWDQAAKPVPSFLDMVPIEGGTFVMGSPEDEPGRRPDEKQYQVTLSPFEISRTTVTRAQYREIMEVEKAPGPGGDEHPVTKVSWFDAAAFCNRLSELDGLKPCYRIDGRDVEWTDDAGGYRLPTEAEWEYAARAGSEGRWPFPAGELDRYAWFSKNADGHSHEVGTREPNPWGLHDMHGNAWEWCWDGYAKYPSEPAEDPRGPEAPAASRVLRGGSFINGPRFLRSAVRVRLRPVLSDERFGFRCVRRPRRPSPPTPLPPAPTQPGEGRRHPPGGG